MHWTDPDMDNGYEPWINLTMWQDSMPSDALARFQWEAQGITRRTTAGPSTRHYNEYAGYFVATQAIRQIEEAVANDEPFLCWTAFAEPHPPWYPPKDYYALVDPESVRLPAQRPDDATRPHPVIEHQQREWQHLTEYELRQILVGYYGLVALGDSYIGMVLDALDRLGIRDDTAILFLSDHGEQLYEHRLFTKFCMREASVHVPFLMSVPGVAPGPRDALAEHVDVFPTICDLVGTDAPADLPGSSLVPLLHHETTPPDWRDTVYSEIVNVRTVGHIQMIRTADRKLNVYDGEPGELFALDSDPDEFYNLISDPRMSEDVAALTKRVRTWAAANTRA